MCVSRERTREKESTSRVAKSVPFKNPIKCQKSLATKSFSSLCSLSDSHCLFTLISFGTTGLSIACTVNILSLLTSSHIHLSVHIRSCPIALQIVQKCLSLEIYCRFCTKSGSEFYFARIPIKFRKCCGYSFLSVTFLSLQCGMHKE